MKKSAIFLAAVFAVAVHAEVKTYQQSSFTEASLTWTEHAEGTNRTVLVNDADYPWRFLTFEVSQPANETNEISIEVFRAFDYEEQFVGDVVSTNAFGQVVTNFVNQVTNQVWKVMTNVVFEVTQTDENAVYHADSDPSLPPIYVMDDDVVVVNHDFEDGFFFRLTGEK